MSTARTVLLAAALLCAGIGTGSAYTFFFDFNPSDSTTAFWVVRIQHAIRHAGVALFVVQPAAFVATVGAAALSWRDRPSAWFLVAAALALVAAAAVTRFGNVPLNWQMETWNADALPANAAALVREWWTFHVVRSAVLVIGLLSLIVAALLRGADR